MCYESVNSTTMKHRSGNGKSEKSPMERRKTVVVRVIDFVQFLQRSKDIEAKSEALEIERWLEQRKREIETGKALAT